MSRAGTNGMTKILSFLRGYFAKDGDVIKTVNDQHADSNGNLDLRVVPAAQQLVTDDGKTEIGTFIDRTTGGEDSIGDGKVDVMQIRGNSTHTGIVQESITMTVQMTTRQEGQEGISAVIDEDAFKEAVSISGTTTLTYTTAWSTAPATYGVTVTGTPLAGDTITIVYVKADRGTITVATPSAFRETGWNLYNHSLGYARVKKYASSALFAIAGSYTALQFSETLTGEKTDVGVSSGYFTIAKDGYIWVTGGNNTNTEIYMCWSDWIDGHTGIAWEAYREDLLDLSDIMTACFPYGLMAVGGVYDEINLTNQKVISRVQRIAYTDEAAEEAAASGRKWDADTNYIYIERATAIETDLESILDEYDSSETYAAGTLCWYGTSAWRCTTAIGVAEAWNANHWMEAWRMTANDHGLEIFDDTTVGTTIMVLYGENLVDKLRRDIPAEIAQNAQDIKKVSDSMCYVVNGNKSIESASIPVGAYVRLVNSAIVGRSDGIYTVKTAIPVAPTTIDSSYFNESVPIAGGIGNALNGKIPTFYQISTICASLADLITEVNKYSTGDILMARGSSTVANALCDGSTTSLNCVINIYKSSSSNAYYCVYNRNILSFGNISLSNGTANIIHDVAKDIDTTSLTKIGNYEIYYAKQGHIVTVQTLGWIAVDAPASSSYVTLATLPEGYRPTKLIRFGSGSNGDTSFPEVEINTDGKIKVYAWANKINRPEFCISFFV